MRRVISAGPRGEECAESVVPVLQAARLASAVPAEEDGGSEPEDRQAGRPGLQQASAVHPEWPDHRE